MLRLSVMIISMDITHLEAVTALGVELGYPNSIEQVGKRFLELMKLPNHALFVYHAGEVVGWIHLEAVSDLIENTKVEVKALIVNEKNRGQGVGKALLNQAKEWTRLRGNGTIILSSNVKRDSTHAFYEREGFRLVKTSHFFECQV